MDLLLGLINKLNVVDLKITPFNLWFVKISSIELFNLLLIYKYIKIN